MNTNRNLLKMIEQRRKRWIGHILRGNGLLKEVIEGRMEGKRTVGRRRKRFMDMLNIGRYEDIKRKAQQRDQWRN